MNRLIEQLLKVTFPSIQVQGLLEVVNATPKPELATEILCGLYVEPNFRGHTNVMYDGKVRRFVSFDKWNDRVTYSYLRPERKTYYFHKLTDRSALTEADIPQAEPYKYDTGQISKELLTGKEEKVENYMEFEHWMKLEYVPTEGELRQKAAENIYAE